MEQGHCTKCNSVNLDYGVMKVADESIGYPYTCNICGHEGIEWYNLDYVEST